MAKLVIVFPAVMLVCILARVSNVNCNLMLFNKNKGIIRRQGSDYLVYALLDAIIDGFFPVLELYGERIDELEEEVIMNPSQQTLQKIYQRSV